MSAVRPLVTVAVLAALICGISGTQNIVPDKNEGRKNKNADEMQEMYTAFMMMKNVVSMMLMFVSPIIQIKGFGLSVLNTLLNIGRFVMQMQATKRLQEMAEAHAHPLNMLPQVFHADHKAFMEHHADDCKNNHNGDCTHHHKDHGHQHKDLETRYKDFDSRHNDHEKDHATSVYIIKESSSKDLQGGNDHVGSRPGQSYSSLDREQPSPWSPSQKLAYYTPPSPPGHLFFSRLGVSPGTSPPGTVYDLSPHYHNYDLTGIR